MTPPIQPVPNNPGKKPSSIENLITCPSCEFVYDTRFLTEHCRMVDGEGFRCQNCDSLLLSI